MRAIQSMRSTGNTRLGWSGLSEASSTVFAERRNRIFAMNAQTSPPPARQIYWPSVITVISAAILIGAEVFGAAFAGGWALAILFGLDDFGAHILQAILFGLGVVIMVAFIRTAQRIEPFTRRG